MNEISDGVKKGQDRYSKNGFDESKHPRASDGKFGSGGGGGKVHKEMRADGKEHPADVYTMPIKDYVVYAKQYVADLEKHLKTAKKGFETMKISKEIKHWKSEAKLEE